MKKDKQELMRKVKALAEQGYGGEAENAKRLLQKLIDQYGPLDIETETKRERHEFRYHDEMERRLLTQILYAVTNGSDIYTLAMKRKIKMLGVYCTEREALEIDAQFAFYNAHMKKEMEIFLHAFIQMNNIFPKDCKHLHLHELDKDEIKKLKRMMSMMEGMEVAEYRQRLEA